MPTWVRSIMSIGAGVMNTAANGTSWKQIGLSIFIGLMGVVSQMSSTSDKGSVTGVQKTPSSN